MSYSGFTGYHSHSQLALLTPNSTTAASNVSSLDTHLALSNSPNVATMNGSVNEDNTLQSVSTNVSLSPSSSSSVCALPSAYDSRIISSYPRLPALYSSSYPDQNSFYPSHTANPFYSSFGHPYEVKDPNGGWSALPQTMCYPYEASLYNPYGDRYSAMDSAARRKNVTRETTNTLKAWLHEHRKNPYPTKGEKIMLAIITKMTLTQVSTWFANARRRLKKENKMTWEPRNRCDDEEDDDIVSSDDESENKPTTIRESDQTSNICHMNTTNKDLQTSTSITSITAITTTTHRNESFKDITEISANDSIRTSNNRVIIPSLTNSSPTHCSSSKESLHHSINDKCNSSNSSVKPKIWSLAATAIDDKPKSPIVHSNHLHAQSLHPTSLNAIHSSAISASTPTNMTAWYHHSTQQYPSVNPYGAHYVPSLQRHFHQTSEATSIPPQADTPPQTPPAIKLASLQLLSSESGAFTTTTTTTSSDHLNCVQSSQPKLISYRNQQLEQIGQSGNTSPPTQSASEPNSSGQALGVTPASASSNSPVGAGAATPVTITGAPPRAPSSATPCCESGRPVLTDPITGQTVCSCQYDAHLLNYQRLAASTGIPLGMYGPAAAAAAAYGAAAAGAGEGFPLPIPPEQLQSAFYSPTANGFDLKENLEAWRNLPYAAAASMYYPYDGGALAGYPFANGYGMDLNGARRKNATRETTSTLKAWLNEHRKNPYPTKGEKIMLAIITKMTLTQVSTWFANARRRLKKENKMTWSPRNRCDDDDDADLKDGSGSGINDRDRDGDATNSSQRRDEGESSDIVDIEEDSNPDGHGSKRRQTGSPHSDVGSLSDSDVSQSANNGSSLNSQSSHHLHPHHTLPSNKPRIWSIVDTATNNSSSLSLLPLTQTVATSKSSPIQVTSSGSLGPISPSASSSLATRNARLDYLTSPYPKPGAPHWFNPANFGVSPSTAFSPLYTCPPSAIMGHLTGGGSGNISYKFEQNLTKINTKPEAPQKF